MRRFRHQTCRAGCVSRRVEVAVLVAATLLTVSCQRGRPTEPRNLLLITLDTTRADRLGPWGYEEARTPTIDRLATEGTLYERAYAPAPETLPAHASLFTGLYPPSHGVRLNLSYRLPEPAQTLAELVRQRGFFNAAVISAGVLDRQYGLNQGFVVYDDMSEGPRRERRAEAVTERALEVLAGQEEERFFLWVHYYDPHDPYDPPEPFAGPDDAPPVDPRLYDLEIAYTDHWIGRLLDELEARSALEETLIVLVADHGESLGDHGESAHTLFIYDSTIHVPLILVGPGIEAGQRVYEPVPSIDIFATLTKIFGLTPPENSSRPLPGLGLEPSGSDGPDRIPRVVYSESMTPPLRYGWNVLQAARSDKWLYIRAPREELYPLDGTTPAQQANVAELHPDVLQNHRRLLGRTLSQMSEPAFASESGHSASEAEQERLAALGYLGTSSAAPKDAGRGKDPKDMVEVAEAIQLGHLALRLGRLEQAEELLTFAAAADRENFGARLYLGQVYLQMEDYEKARDVFQRAADLQLEQWRVQIGLASAEEGLGNVGTAVHHLETALASSPFPAEVWRRLGRLRLAHQEWERAAEAYRELLRLQPDDERAQDVLRQLEEQGLIEGAPGIS
jgi:arylsulfatase A-like enzyme/Tfp pilus assembly protein PilF